MTTTLSTRVPAVLAALLIAAASVGCDGDGGDSSGATQTATETVPPLTVRVTELQTGIAGYCEDRSSGSASRADERRAATDVRELIRLARRRPDRLRATLTEVSIVLNADCRDSPLRRRVDRALTALP